MQLNLLDLIKNHEFLKDPRNASNRMFFRNHRTALQIIDESKNWNGIIRDDSNNYNYQIDLLGGESCEVFSDCVE